MSETDKRNAARIAAVKTLERLGYTYEGGAEWKPPLGKTLDAFERLMAAVADARTAVLGMAPSFELIEWRIGCVRPYDLGLVIQSSPSFCPKMLLQTGVRPMPVGEFELMGVKIRGVAK